MNTTERLLARMPPEVAATFTPLQQHALHEALQPRQHTIDLRLSIPWIWTRFYLVVLVGEEKRSASRRRLEAAKHPVWTVCNFIAIMSTTSLLGFGLISLIQLSMRQSSSLLDRDPAPAEIPFKADQESCESSGRVWADGACFDYNHSPKF